MLKVLSLLGVLPALLLMAYFDRLDAKRPEPRSTLRRVAIAGALSAVPCAIVELGLIKVGPPQTTYLGALWISFVVAGGVEELSKLLCIRWFVWHRPEFDERMDGITYGTRAALGFALVENVLYLLVLAHRSVLVFVVVFLARAFLSVPLHALTGAIIGYYAARKRFDGIGPGAFGGYLRAVLMHGSFDAALFLAVVAAKDEQYGLILVLVPVPFALIIGGIIVVRRMVRSAIAADDAAELVAQAAQAAQFQGTLPV